VGFGPGNPWGSPVGVGRIWTDRRRVRLPLVPPRRNSGTSGHSTRHCCRSPAPLDSWPVGQSPARGLREQAHHALGIGLVTGGEPVVELREMPRQMLPAHIMVRAVQTPRELGEI
jgi:hypothetical protein